MNLGVYAADVLIAYGVSFVIIALITGLSWAGARKSKRMLAQIEAQIEAKNNGG